VDVKTIVLIIAMIVVLAMLMNTIDGGSDGRSK
jgi:hypothetical protein